MKRVRRRGNIFHFEKVVCIFILVFISIFLTTIVSVKAQETDEIIAKQAAALNLSIEEFELLDQTAREEFSKVYPFLHDYPDFPIGYKRVPELWRGGDGE